MRALIFESKKDVKVKEIPVRKPGDDEIVINIKACGVCGTDVHTYEGDDTSAKVVPPVVLGHELSGVISEVGKNVFQHKVGDRVVVDPNLACGKCYFCRNGKNHFCENRVGAGLIVDGGMAEYITTHESVVYKIPDFLQFEIAAMTEPVSCCIHGMDLLNILSGDTVLIIGGGTIGQIMLQLSRNAGAGIIIMVEPVDKKRKIALKYGADIVIDPYKENIPEVINRQKIKNIDKIIECAGLSSAVEASIDLAGKGATIMWFGLTNPVENQTINQFKVFQKELTLKSSFINPYTMERAIILLGKKMIKVEELISAVVCLEDMPGIFEDMALIKEGKVIVKP
jgi:L-iditol 2-dehydrogenase